MYVESRKIVLMNLSQRRKKKDSEKGLVDTAGEEEGGKERAALTHIDHHV